MVSVVIPTFNRASLIPEALASVFAQTVPVTEIIVIDDGSTDETPDVLRRFGDRIVVARQKNKGPSAARNAGMRMAHSEYIAFLDSDDLWLPDKNERQLAFLERHPDVDFVFGDLVNFWDGGKTQSEKSDNLQDRLQAHGHHVSDMVELLVDHSFTVTSTLMFRRSCLDTIGYFDESLQQCEDLELWIRAALTFRFGYLGERVARRRRHDGNLVNDWVGRQNARIGVLERALQTSETLSDNQRWVIRRRLNVTRYDLASRLLKDGDYRGANRILARCDGEMRKNLKWIAKRCIASVLGAARGGVAGASA